MNKIEELRKELNGLVSGYISIKNISNRKYYYLKYYENGKQKSKYIKENQLSEIKKQLALRKKIEQEIQREESNERNITQLSKNALSLNGSIMMENKKVAIFKDGQLIYKDERLCPLLIKRTNNISLFLKGRSIDTNRTNSRLLKKVLNINTNNEEQIPLYSYGAVITDNYWFKPRGCKLKYKDICFNNDYYSDLALKGELTLYLKSPKHTPQITAIGSFEKCWKKIDDNWWLYKKGTPEQIYSELFSSLLAQKLNIDSAIYEYDDGYIRTLNFATKYNFEPMFGLVGDDESYNTIFNSLFDISENLADQYLKLCFFDCLINNIDRHNENLGFLRDKKSGKIISLAPNFDNNLALLGFDSKLMMEPNKDGFIKLFLDFIKENKIAYERFKKIKIESLNTSDIKDCIKQIPIKLDEYDVSTYVFNRYKYIINFKNKMK